MKTLYLDCFSGISGNMFVGMLLQSGVSFERFSAAMASLGLTGYSLVCRPVVKAGIQALYYNVLLDEEGHGYQHGHDHHHDQEHHGHRNLQDITEIIEKAPLENEVKERSLAVFSQLAQAEAKVHGIPVASVHFHEVGAVDCILDIVGTVWALKELGIEQIGASPLHVGSGFVRCAHGLMPVPAPATAELLTGIPYYAADIRGELVTPTGAALVKTLAAYIGPRPKEFVHHGTAYGAGTKDLEIPNVLRGFIGEAPHW